MHLPQPQISNRLLRMYVRISIGEAEVDAVKALPAVASERRSCLIFRTLGLLRTDQYYSVNSWI